MPLSPSSIVPTSFAKTQTASDGVARGVLLVPLGLGEHRAVVARSLLVPSELLSEDMGFPPSAPIVFSNSPALTVSHSPPCEWVFQVAGLPQAPNRTGGKLVLAHE